MRRDVADLNLRAMGTGVSAQMLVPIRLLDPRRRAVLLIHGYNVSEREAVAALGTFRKGLAHFAPALLPDTFICTWAGNWNLPGLRPAAYPFMLRNARLSAETLLEALQEWYARPNAPEELVVVAHSLGCRLTLEMLCLMAGRRPAGLRRLVVVLMAAAVPVEHLDLNGRLAQGVGVADTTVLLHSDADRVLSLVFGLGQTLAGDGFMPEALGLHGRPRPPGWTAEPMRAFDHGDYWSEIETAEVVCRVLNLPIAPGTGGVPLAVRRRLPRSPDLLASPLPTYAIRA